jgi:hypothetical protein
MSKIWLLGFEGDEGMIANHAFSSKEKAKTFKKLFAKDYEIFDLELDPYDEEIQKGLTPYNFYLDMYGNLLSYSQFEKNDCFVTSVDVRLGAGSGLQFVCNIVAKDTDNALRIAKERVVEILKSGKWESPIDREISIRKSVKNQKGECYFSTSFMGSLEELFEFKNQLKKEITEILA